MDLNHYFMCVEMKVLCTEFILLKTTQIEFK